MSASLSLILTLSILLIPVRSHYKANTRMTKVWAPIITLIQPQPDKQTVTRHPVLLLGLTCHTTTVFAQLKSIVIQWESSKSSFFYLIILHFGLESYIVHLTLFTSKTDLCQSNYPIQTKTHSPSWNARLLSLSLSCDGWWLWEWRGPGGDRQAPGELVTPGPGIGGVTSHWSSDLTNSNQRAPNIQY